MQHSWVRNNHLMATICQHCEAKVTDFELISYPGPIEGNGANAMTKVYNYYRAHEKAKEAAKVVEEKNAKA